MRKLLLMLMMLVLSIPIWASEHTVTISRGEVLEDKEVSGVLAYYCVKDGVMMTFTGGLDNDNYLVESNNQRFEVRSGNYIIKRIVFHCMDNTLEGNYDSFYWGPTTISAVTNFTYPGQLGNYTVTNNGYDGVWTGTTNAIQFLTKGHPVRFGSVEIVYDKLDGDIFDLVTQRSQIVDNATYVLVSQYHDKVMTFKKTDDATHYATDIVEWMDAGKTRVKVNGNACMIKMLGAKDSTYSNNTRRVARLSTLNNGYIRVGTATDQGNLLVTSSVNDYSRGIMYFGTDNNYLCWFKGDSYSNSSHTIRYDDSDHSFKVMDIDNSDTRVWLYKLAQSYSITTACDPVNGGNVTLGNGVVNGTSQEGETVHFHVGTEWGYRIMQVIVTDETGATITVNTDATAADGNDYSFVMPASNVTVTAQFYETEPDLYLIGTVMGRTNWVPAGPKFDYDPVNQEYYLDVYFKGGADDLSTSLDDQAYGYFSLATQIDSGTHWQDAPAHSGDWSQVTGRLAAEVNNKLVADGETGIALYNDRPDNAFKIPAGIYRITVNRAMTQMSIVQTPVQLFFDPESNTEVDPGTMVTITSDILQKVQPIAARHGIEENRLDYVYKTDEMNNWAYVYDAHQATLEITKIGETQVAAICALNYIEAKDTAYYRITEYAINTVVTPEGAGTINIPVTSSVAGETITFTVDTNYAHSLNAVTLTTGDTQTVLTPDEQGNYTFVMPRGNVTITASFDAIPVYSIQAVVIPSPAGTINVASSAMAGETVEFTITDSSSTTYDDYNIYAVTLTTNDSQETITLTPTNGTYSFVMPSEDVTITVEYRKEFMVRISCTPENGGVVGIERPDGELTSMTYKMEGETVTFYVAPNPNFKLVSITSYNSYFNYTDNGDGYYSFVMPHSQVIINVTFEPVGEYQVNVVNDPTEAGSTSLSGHVKTENGNYYSDATETVVITPVPNTGWAASAVDVVDAQNNPVAVTANGDGTYSLVMPASDVTITAHYARVPYTITTQVKPEGKGTITLMGDAADNDEIAGQTVNFSVVPNYGYTVGRVYYTIGAAQYSVTDNGDGTYSFVMPESNVRLIAELHLQEYVFRRIKHHRDIIEGGKYVYVDYYDGVVMGREYADKPNVLGDVFPKQMLDGGERVSVFSDAAVFEIVNLVDTTYNPQSLDYGWLGEVPYKAAYLKMVDDGSYIGLPDNPVFPYAAELFDVDNPNEKFENLRVLLRVEDRRGFWQNHLSMNEATWSYYPYVWPHPLISKEYHEGEYLKWNIGYSSEHETFYVGRDHPIYLYKMPQPFTVTTRCVEQGWGDIQLSGVDGNIAMDGDVVTVTPVAATGYGFVELTVTINGTGEVLDVTDNHDGTYSFVMPAADVTVTATYGPAHRLTLTVADESIGHCVYSSLVIGDADIDFMGETPTYYQQNDILPNVPVNFDIRLDDYYAIKSVTITNDNTGEVSEFLRYETDDDENPGYLCLFGFNMPNNNATVTVNVIPGHKVTCVPMLYDSESGDYVEVDPDQCGRIVVEHLDSDGYYTSVPIYFEKDDEMAVGVTHNEGYRLDHVTAVCDATGEVIVLTVSYEDMLPGFYTEAFYEFSMPDDDVTFTAYFVPFTPLALIEKPNNSGNGFNDGDPVTVDDELIGVWAVANPETGKKLLWAKDQSPYRSYDWVERPEGTIDYVRQNMKLQKKDWSQSNWVVLDFSNLLELWEGSEESFNQKMEDLVDHKIIAGTVTGTYHCEGDIVKAKHRIVLDEWPQAVNPNDVTSLGYPGYAEDPKEEKAYDYKYNHYVPANFMQEYVSGLYGGLEAGDDGVVPGAEAGNPDYADKRWFFMKPKDAEVAQVWAVWLGSYELYDEFSDETRDGHVFETYVSDPVNGVNMYDFGGAFFVPSWDYNRWTTGDGADHYGFPDGEVSLVANTDYLFHVAIETHGEKYDDDQPISAPRRGQGTQAREDAPWSYYSVYPLDLDPTNSTTTGLNEVNAPASTTIDSIRYYNVMGQESRAPFDGINIMVIRYKDGSMISKKILR